MVSVRLEKLEIDSIYTGMNDWTQKAHMEMSLPPASLYAYQQLLELNMQTWRPEVTEWLHSDEAEPVLAQLLINVPCSPTLH